MKTLQMKTILIRNFFCMLKRYYPSLIVNEMVIERGGMLWALDPKVLFTAVNAIKPKIILEIGTYRGGDYAGIGQ
jgi:hypothetical protein